MHLSHDDKHYGGHPKNLTDIDPCFYEHSSNQNNQYSFYRRPMAEKHRQGVIVSSSWSSFIGANRGYDD